jgi:multidrug efflux pump
LSATILAIFFVPMFFVVVLRLFGHRSGGDDAPLQTQPRTLPDSKEA